MTDANAHSHKYYDDEYVEHVAEATRRFLQARNTYVAAWLEFQDTCIGGGFAPEEEGRVIESILKQAKKDGGR